MAKLSKLLKFISPLTLVVVSSAAFAMGAPARENDYHLKSLEHLAARGGVKPESLETFFFSLKESPKTRADSTDCMDELESSETDRFLDCLSLSGSKTLTPALGHALFRFRAQLLHEKPSKENLGTLALVSYLEDLVREKLRIDGASATWIVKDGGYLRGGAKTDFDFQDGDIVLGLGNTSISSLISQITNTPSRYSHAFIVRKRAGKISTIESLIETGVKEFPLSHLLKDPYNQLTVLRWKDPNTRARVAARASDWAHQVARRKAPYDMKMDFSEDHAIYCSELLVKAYAKAAGLDPRKLVFHQSQIENARTYNFAKLLGVTNKVFFSPGDIFNSPYLEVVADYRKPDDLMKSWELYLMGDLFIERLEEGHKIKPGPIYTTVPMVVWITQLLPSIFHEDARLIPKSVGAYSLAVMATTQMRVYDPAIKSLKKSLTTRSLLDHAPWTVRGELERTLDTSATVRSSFSR